MRTENGGVSFWIAKSLCGINGFNQDFQSICASAGVLATESFYPQDIQRIRSFLHGMPVITEAERRQPPILCVRGTEGRVGKTEVTAHLAGGFAYSGMRTLLIDADPQAGLTMMFGIAGHRVTTHLAELMRCCYTGQPYHIDQAVLPLYPDHMLDVLPVSFSLADEHRLNGMAQWELALKQLLWREQAFFARYDLVIIDCAPDNWLIGKACLNICDKLLTVAAFRPSSLAVLDSVAANIHALSAKLQRKVELHIAFNWYIPHEISSRKACNVRDRLKDRHGNKFVHDLTIPDHATELRVEGCAQPEVEDAVQIQPLIPWNPWRHTEEAQLIFSVFDRPIVNHAVSADE